jgi:hypothetical protein
MSQQVIECDGACVNGEVTKPGMTADSVMKFKCKHSLGMTREQIRAYEATGKVFIQCTGNHVSIDRYRIDAVADLALMHSLLGGLVADERQVLAQLEAYEAFAFFGDIR